MSQDSQELLSPVEAIPEREELDEAGVALCLSGGGYRAMIFHLGALWRLNESGWLRKLTRISSVSGGSITAGLLGLRWSKLQFDVAGVASNFPAEVVEPVQSLADRTIDEGSILAGLFTPGTVSDKVTKAYEKYLFGEATLQDLPTDGVGPRFVINSTNVQTGALWRFSRPYMADYRVGMIRNPTIHLSVAVAASSAFPPVLSPLKLEVDPTSFDQGENGDLHEPPYTSDVVLTDGGVYDNLGLETAWKRCGTVLVSDGGGQMQPEAEPKSDWVRHALRINSLIDNQVRCLRKRQVVGSFELQKRKGTYWGIRSHVVDYHLGDAFDCPPEKTLPLAGLQTRFKRLDRTTQQRLINWGYAICDTALRKWVLLGTPKPASLPFPKAGLG